MIDYPIIDSHVHLWDLGKLRYPWLGAHPVLNHTFLIEEFDAARGPVEIKQFVFVEAECDHSLSADEVAWVTELSHHDPRIGAIVARVPVEEGECVRPALTSLSANPLVKGIRRIIADEPESDFCLRPDFIAGVQSLAEYQLSFDLGVCPDQLTSVAQLVEQCPNVQFVLDHLGNPAIKDRQMLPWMIDLPALADYSNVWCKISGVATQADHARWTPDDLKPYVDLALDVFGCDRVMFGGDWPVALQAATYPRWVDALCEITRDRSRDDVRALFHDNARAFYRLEG